MATHRKKCTILFHDIEPGTDVVITNRVGDIVWEGHAVTRALQPVAEVYRQSHFYLKLKWDKHWHKYSIFTANRWMHIYATYAARYPNTHVYPTLRYASNEEERIIRYVGGYPLVQRYEAT